jgi:hypothetical protein
MTAAGLSESITWFDWGANGNSRIYCGSLPF